MFLFCSAHDETLSLSFENESKSFPAEDEMKEADSIPETSMHSCPFSRAKLHYVYLYIHLWLAYFPL